MRYKQKILLSLWCISSLAWGQQEINSTVYTENKLAVSVTASQPNFTIRLKSNMTTGYSWYLLKYNETLVQPIKHTYEANSAKKLLGAPGEEVWFFKAKPNAFVVPQQTSLQFIYARPWEINSNAKDLTFQVTTH